MARNLDRLKPRSEGSPWSHEEHSSHCSNEANSLKGTCEKTVKNLKLQSCFFLSCKMTYCIANSQDLANRPKREKWIWSEHHLYAVICLFVWGFFLFLFLGFFCFLSLAKWGEPGYLSLSGMLILLLSFVQAATFSCWKLQVRRVGSGRYRQSRYELDKNLVLTIGWLVDCRNIKKTTATLTAATSREFWISTVALFATDLYAWQKSVRPLKVSHKHVALHKRQTFSFLNKYVQKTLDRSSCFETESCTHRESEGGGTSISWTVLEKIAEIHSV